MQEKEEATKTIVFLFPPHYSCSVAAMCTSLSLFEVIAYHTVMCYTYSFAGLFLKYMGLLHHKVSSAEIPIC